MLEALAVFQYSVNVHTAFMGECSLAYKGFSVGKLKICYLAYLSGGVSEHAHIFIGYTAVFSLYLKIRYYSGEIGVAASFTEACECTLNM